MTTKISSGNIQTATLTAIGSGIKISQIIICDSSYAELDDTAISLSGGYIKIIGTGFKTGATVAVNRSLATSVTFISSTEIRAQVPALAAGTYVVYVSNSDGAVAIRVNGLTFSSEPTWVTGSNLPAGDSGTAISIQLTATSATVYTLQAGSTLPANLTLSSGGLLSGTVTIDNETLYNFTVVATDVEFQDSPRTFSINITSGDPFFAATTLLLSGSADTFVKDASTNNFPITVVGDTKPNNFNPYLTGWSNYFDGTGDYLTLPANNGAFAFGTGDFTIEMWVNPDTVAPTYQQLAGASYSASGGSVYLAASQVTFFSSGANATTPVASIKTGTWQHIAVVRASGVLKIYINGAESSSVAYTQNLTTADGQIGARTGSTVEPYKGYISNLRVIKGTALYTANFTPSTTTLAAVSNTSLLTCQSNLFVDNSINNFALTRSGDVKIQSFSPFVESASINGSGYFDGNGDYLTVSDNAAFDFTGDFAIEAWVYPTVIGANNAIAAQWVTGGLAFLYKVITNGRLQFVANTGASVTVTATTTTVGLNQWSHVAVTRSGTTVRLFVNGVMDTTTGTVSGTLASTTPLTIGTVGSETVQYWNGYLSNLRIVKGTAVYTANFTPSTSPLTAVSGTSLLTLQTDIPQTNSQFLDSSSNNSLVTRVGNTTQGTFSPYSPSGWSNYFDGTGDFLVVSSATAFDQDTNFTIEMWLNVSSYPGSNDAKLYQPNGAGSLAIAVSTAGKINIDNQQTGNTIVSVATLTRGQWYHIALVRNGPTTNNLTLYVNGVADTTVSYTNWQFSPTQVTIGRRTDTNTDYTGYISNLRVVKGTAVYTAAFTPSTTPLTAIPGTVLLTCADNRIIDDSPNNFAVTRTGDVRVTNFAPFTAVTQTPVTYSAYFDGNNDYITPAAGAAFTIGTGDFTYECWVNRQGVNPISAGNALTVFDTRTAEPSIAPCLFWENDAMKYYVNGANRIVSTSTFPIGTWAHIAIVRLSGVTKMYVNGVQEGDNYTDANNYVGTVTNIGGRFAAVSGDFRSWFGYMSNARIVKGTAVYTANFAPPTVPLTAVAGTSLLTCQSATFEDNSTNRFVITATGNSQPTTINPFGSSFTNSTGYTAAAHGGSMYFDGTGDYLEMPANTIFDFGANNFTMECWVFPLTTGVVTGFISNWQTGGQFILRKSTGNRPVFVYDPVSVAAVTVTGTTTTIVTGMWNHVAVVRNGSLYTMYVNGVADATTSTSAAALEVLGKPLRIGVDSDATNPMNGYISDVRIIKGQALYTSNFVPPLAPVLPVQNTTVLLNGTSAGIVDATTKTVLETVGDTKISTAVSKFGGSSMFFDGTGDYLIAPASNLSTVFGTGDFTVEFWVNRSSGTRFVEFSTGLLYIDGNGKLVYYSTSARIVSTDVFPSNQWVYVALARASGQSKLYVNGVQTGSTFTDAINYTSGALVIGTDNGSKSLFLTGYMQDLRITTGVARYTANFTPPTVPLSKK